MESPDDFYIYLNDRLNKNQFPHNTASGFTNIIHPGLHLNTNYEVALKNIIFNPDIYTIKKFDETFWIFIYVSFNTFEGNIGAFGLKYIPNASISASSIFQLIQLLNNDLVNFLIVQQVIDDDQDFIFRMGQFSTFVQFKELKPKTKYKSFDVSWNFSENFANVIGLTERQFENKPRILDPPSFPKKLNMIYVYTDMVEPSYLGQQSVHLLDVLPMQEAYCKNGSLTMYKQVNKTSITDISLKLLDFSGQPVPFMDNVTVLAVLHFRRTA